MWGWFGGWWLRHCVKCVRPTSHPSNGWYHVLQDPSIDASLPKKHTHAYSRTCCARTHTDTNLIFNTTPNPLPISCAHVHPTHHQDHHNQDPSSPNWAETLLSKWCPMCDAHLLPASFSLLSPEIEVDMAAACYTSV